MHACMHTYMHARTHTHTHTPTYIHTYIRTYVCVGMLDTYGYSQNMQYLLLSTALMVTRTRLRVTFYVRALPVLSNFPLWVACWLQLESLEALTLIKITSPFQTTINLAHLKIQFAPLVNYLRLGYKKKQLTGRAMAYAVNRCPLTGKPRIRSLTRPREILLQANCDWDKFFSEYFGFPLSISFHQRSILTCIYMLLLTKEQRSKLGYFQNRTALSELQ
jgi:hypothetical protein